MHRRRDGLSSSPNLPAHHSYFAPSILLYLGLQKAAKLESPSHMQEREEKEQLNVRLEAIAADVSAARSETAALRAWKKTAAEQALSYEAQVKHQGLSPLDDDSAILPLTVTQKRSV